MIDDALLATLMTVEATSGDEDRLTDLLAELLPRAAPGVTLHRIGATLIAAKGKPRTAVFAHLDSVGFTLGYGGKLISVGGPDPEPGTPIRSTVGDRVSRGKVGVTNRQFTFEGEGQPGSRWVYDTAPAFGEKSLTGAYLDNRFGVYTGVHLLQTVPDVLVAFTAGEEASGRGALDAGRWVYENTAIRKCLIADITWSTQWVKPGGGPAVSLRDAFVPRRVFFDAVRAIAERANVPHQIEIESSGSSDGGYIERSGFGIDWLFVGAPEKGYHSATESLLRSDAENMLRLYAALVTQLT